MILQVLYFIWKRSGYYGNLGSLKAGTRHHGDYSVMGNSFPPTFPEDLLAHASQWLANCREACKYDELERQYKCSARDNTSESELNAAWLN